MLTAEEAPRWILDHKDIGFIGVALDERHLSVAIGVGGAIALAIIGYLLQWISS